MKAYTVSYDLQKPGKDYSKLISRLEQMGAQRVLLSYWILKSSMTAIQIRDDLKQYIDTNDRLLVAEITNNWASYNVLLSPDKLKQIAA